MEHDSERVNPVDELAFFGRVAASVSHELSNIVSTIHQVTGLLEDLVAGVERGQPASIERLKTIHGRLSRQTARGIEVIQNLNRFAHSVDERPVRFELNGVIGNLIAVVRRFADLKDVDLEVSYSPEDIYVFNDPFCLKQVVFLAVAQALEAATRGDVLRIVVQREVAGAAVKVVAPRLSKLGEKDSLLEPLQILTERLRSKIFLRREGDSECILLEISDGQAPDSFRPPP